MSYFKGILSVLAAIIIAESVFVWPLLKDSKATGLAALLGLSVENFLSPRFWVVGILLLGCLGDCEFVQSGM